MSSSRGLFRLVYLSRNAIVGDPTAIDGEIGSILTASRRKNRSETVTGALMFDQDTFLQTLEGPEDAVWRLFDRIALDHRHVSVELMDAAPAGRRDFGDWSMAYAGHSKVERLNFRLLLQRIDLQGAAAADEAVGVLLAETRGTPVHA